tara:strand:+ start:1780 stop:2685 length:906 start_codon:yes stop_codon:yes gene_type:complete
MKIDYIIPTIGRPEIERTKQSIFDERINHNILICDTENSAGENRNKCLEKVKDSDWIVFVDDDDYLVKGHSKELDKNYDCVVLRMKKEYEDVIIPRYNDNELRSGNIGINFALNTKFYLKHKFLFDSNGNEEDWRFFARVFLTTKKIKITDDIYYIAPKGNYNKMTNSDFKQNITNISKGDRDKYFQLPQNIKEHSKSKGFDKTMSGIKRRLEEQLEIRKEYVQLLENKQKAYEDYLSKPNEETKKELFYRTAAVDKHNLDIEITAQKNVFLDTYIYYKEDFLKRYENDKGKKQSVFIKNK